MVYKFGRTQLSTLNRRFYASKRKYPVDPDHPKTLPVFDYGESKKGFNRVYVWGNLLSGALGVPYLKRNENVLHREEILSPKRLGFAEKFPVVAAACGFGFTAFAVDSNSEHKVYGTGLNTDAQIGRHEVRAGHPLEIIYFPQPIHIPFKNVKATKVHKVAAGRAHLAVLSDEGVFLLGNNSYGQCAREIVPDENYFLSGYINHVPKIQGQKIVDVVCGQDHTIAVTENGQVYACGWGADGQTGVGSFDNTSEFTQARGDIQNERIVRVSSRSDFVLAVNDRGEVFGWGNAEYDQITTPSKQQQVCHPTHMDLNVGNVVDVAAGGSFCVVCNDSGEVFVWGFGLLGAGPKVEHSSKPIKLPSTLFGRNDFQPTSRVTRVACGLSYAMAVTNLGDIYAWGRNVRSCLGLRHKNDQYFPFKVSLGGSGVEVCCGFDHTVAICKPFN